MINQPTSLIMSGVESDVYFNIAVSVGVNRLLMSYKYIQRKGKKFLRERLADHPNMKIMLDSGAYTFITKEEYHDKPVEYWEDYLDKYTKFIRDNRDLIFAAVELDLVGLVGAKKVDEWRENYFKPLEDEGILVCYVWHEEDGMQQWKTMCQKYKYVGFSFQTSSSLTDTDVVRMLNTAKLNNAIVHGFALTKIELLTRMPFFSVDSTTWLVGTKYGELNWFDGRKWTRLKKDKWKRQYKNKFIKLGANWELAEKENPYELIRINLLVFMEAEKYIQKRLRAKMYWIKGGTPMGLKKLVKVNKETPVTKVDHEIMPEKKVKKLKKLSTSTKKGVPEREDLEGRSKFDEFFDSIKTLDNIDFPAMEWFKGECNDWEVYAEDLNISHTTPKDEAVEIMFTMTAFIKHEEEINDPSNKLYVEDEELNNLYTFYFEEKDLTREDMIEELRKFYIDNVLGNRNDFKEVEVVADAKERDDYLTEEEYEVVELDEEEVEAMLPAIPEVDVYDAELRSHGIEVTRDSKGRFLKGQTSIRKPKNIYSQLYPKLQCSTCYKAGDCPEYKEGYVCKFDKLFSRFDTRNAEDVVDALQSIVNVNLGRMQRMMMFETMDGGMVDPAVTTLIDQNVNLLMKIKDLSRGNFMASQRTTISPDGTKVVENELRVNPPGGSILEKLFMNSGRNDDEESI